MLAAPSPRPLELNPSSPRGDTQESLALKAMPALFVLLWSTGFIGAKLGLPYAPPLKFLLWRFLFVIVLMGAIAVATGATWPRGIKVLHWRWPASSCRPAIWAVYSFPSRSA